MFRHGYMNVTGGKLQVRYTREDGTDIEVMVDSNAEFVEFLHLMQQDVGHVKFMCSSSCDFPEEYGMTADKLEEIVGGWG